MHVRQDSARRDESRDIENRAFSSPPLLYLEIDTLDHQWGAPDAISDITPAAGWHILDCNPDETKQDILLICLDNNAECNHIINSGARDIIVRLPQSVRSQPILTCAFI